MDRTVFTADRGQLIKAIALNIVVLFATFAILSFFLPSWSLIPAIIIVGGFTLRKVLRFVDQLRNDEIIVLDESGLMDQSYGLGFIPWSNVKDASLREITWKASPFTVVELEVFDEDAYFAESDSLDRKMIKRGKEMSIGENGSVGGLWLNTYQISSTESELLEAVQRYIRKYGREDES